MTSPVFDIYQTDAGYTAVTNPVQRDILEALARGDRQLPELVEMTGKSKPTLSGTHMKELIARELIEELPHPDDARRKVYRIRGTRIGSSDIPVPKLREAVQQYVRSGPMETALDPVTVFEILAAAPADTAPEALGAQARALGLRVAQRFQAGTVRELLMGAARYVEAAGIGEVVRLDLEAQELVLEPGRATPDAARAAAMTAGLLDGIANRAQVDAAVAGHDEAGRIHITVRSAA